MLIGSYDHMLDAKGRVFIPAKWRELLGDMLIVTIGLDTKQEACLYGMSVPEWEHFSEKLSSLPVSDASGQSVRRRLYSMAAACEVDKQGRILIPAQLRELAGLVKDATLIGVGERMEFWNPGTLAAYNARTDESYNEALEHLAQMGI